jgi:hypothetical protein
MDCCSCGAFADLIKGAAALSLWLSRRSSSLQEAEQELMMAHSRLLSPSQVAAE